MRKKLAPSDIKVIYSVPADRITSVFVANSKACHDKFEDFKPKQVEVDNLAHFSGENLNFVEVRIEN
jgi:hypothetical protein